MPRKSAGIAALAVAAACALAARPALAAEDARLAHADCAASHVRTSDPVMQGAFDFGMERSPTFRGLVQALRESDLIVYASSELSMPMPIYGEIHFLTSAGPHRYLRVFVRADLSPWERAAMLAHELQHALEIAAAPEVRDTASMDGLYEKIGYDVGIDRHETDAARNMGAQVLRELTPGSSPGGSR